MEEILNVVRDVRRRTYANLALEHLFNSAFIIGAVLTAVTLFAKLVFLPRLMDAITMATMAGFALAAVYAVVFTRIRVISAAIAADERLGLAERLSTAVAIAGDDSPFAMAAIADAREKAAGIRVAQSFPVALPRRWRHFAVTLAAFLAVLMMPQFDLLGRKAAYEKRERDVASAQREVEKLKKEVASLKRSVSPDDLETLDILKDLDLAISDVEGSRMGKREVLAELKGPLDKLAERMKELAQEFAQSNQNLSAQLGKAAMEKSLADAKSMLDKMDKLLEAAHLSPEQKEKLAKAIEEAMKNQESLSSALSEMANAAEAMKGGELTKEQMEKLAEAMEKLAEAMKEGGLDSQQMAEMMKNMSEAARSGDAKKLAQQMKQAQQAMNTSLKGLNSQLQSLAREMAANGMADPSFSDITGSQMLAEASAEDLQSMADAMKGLGSFQDSLTGNMSMSMAEALEQLEAAMGSGKGQISPFGMKGEGTGTGNTWPVGDDTGDPTLKDKLPGQLQKGRMLSSMYTDGGNIKNESVVELSSVIAESKQTAKEALTDQKVPRAYEKVVGKYFESLQTPQRQ